MAVMPLRNSSKNTFTTTERPLDFVYGTLDFFTLQNDFIFRQFSDLHVLCCIQIPSTKPAVSATIAKVQREPTLCHNCLYVHIYSLAWFLPDVTLRQMDFQKYVPVYPCMFSSVAQFSGGFYAFKDDAGYPHHVDKGYPK
jgi:hypothetical protein